MNVFLFRFRIVSAGILLMFFSNTAEANPKIRAAFFSIYTNAVGTQLDSLPSRSEHCGVCHYNFQSGNDPWNPYGQAIRDVGNLGGKDGPSNAIMAVRFLDSDGDGFTNETEILSTIYANTPTFPGFSAANYSQVVSVDPNDVLPYLTPSTGGDTTPPTVTLTYPNGGQSFVANRFTNVTWTASDGESGVVAVHIYESLDGGAIFRPIAMGLSNSGVYAWAPANRPSTNVILKVVAVDGAVNSSNDWSDAAFSVTSPPGGRVPTTLRDFDMPGTQPFEGGSEQADPENCAQCHGNYDPAVEPYANWQGSMMSHAARDPLFEANVVIANQDAPDSGDLCLRCHFSRGWLEGRSVPTDGSAMLPSDHTGVSCDLCHRLTDPVYVPGISPSADSNIIADLTFKGTNSGNGMFVIDPSGVQRGPYSNAASPHAFSVSPFHRSSALCGTCHDVSNPAFTKDEFGVYQPNDLNAPATNFSPNSLGPVERTYSEWLYSAYNSTGGIYAPAFAGGKPGGYVSSCQDCHMHDVTGYGCDTNINEGVPLRSDIPLHDLTGGSTWIPSLLTNLYPDEVNADAIHAGTERATYLLQNAASIGVRDLGDQLLVTVTNETGHKLPTGYPEGRRIWVNVQFFDQTNGLLSESCAYDAGTGVLTRDAEATIYGVHPGIDTNITNIVNIAAGPSFHFVLNNRIYEDNRIPPRGFSNDTYAAFGGAPIGHHYDDGQYWDLSHYDIPDGSDRAEVRLYYQSTSKEFVEFLRDENTTDTKGQEMYDLWNDNGKCPPTLMASATTAIYSLELTGVPANATNECDAVSAPPAVTATSSCESNITVDLTVTTNTAACPGLYSLQRVWSATDSCGQAVAGTQVVYVADTTAPDLQDVPSNTMVRWDLVPSPAIVTATDACTTSVVVFSETTNTTVHGHDLIRTWSASDSCGNTASATQVVSVIDGSDGDGDGLPGDWELTYFGDPTNALPWTDSDLDGTPNIHELWADTDPSESNSVFKVLQPYTGGTGSQYLLRWNSVSSRNYDISVSTNLLRGFTNLIFGLPGTPPFNIYTDEVPGLNNRYYIIETGPEE